MFVEELDRELCSVGMMMNVKKTKMMVLNGKVKEPITLRGEKIDVEDSFPWVCLLRLSRVVLVKKWQLGLQKQSESSRVCIIHYGRESKCQ
jgi:hypothetical protein